MPPALPAAPAAQDTPRGSTAGDRGASGAQGENAPAPFAGLLAGLSDAHAGAPAATPGEAPAPTAPALPAGEQLDRDADASAHGEPVLPEQVLALLTGQWTALDAATAPGGSRSVDVPRASLRAAPLLPGATTTAASALVAAVPATAGAAATEAAVMPMPPFPSMPQGMAMPVAQGALPLPDAVAAALARPVSGDAASAASMPVGTGIADAFATVLTGAGGGSDSGAEGLTERGPASPLAASASAAPTATRALPPALTQPLALPPNADAGFDDGFGARIGWMAEQGIGRAELRMTPDHIGPIEVRLQIDGTRVSAEFSSHHADVRQSLEASIGRLRDMLGEQGMQLAHAGVGHGGDNDPGRSAQTQGGDANAEPDSDGGGDGGRSDIAHRPLATRGLLDEYA